MKNTVLYQQHIMWYESKMINETLDSLHEALRYSKLPVELKFCLNSQTYIEQPVQGTAESMFSDFINHPVLDKAEIMYKTDDEPFYNIGDWRREVYDSTYKYTVWGESDCLLPKDFFYILSEVNIEKPHLMSFASRKMWDETWDSVEHLELAKYPRTPQNRFQAPKPFNTHDVITQSELDSFNSRYDIEIYENSTVKIDGSLLCLSNGIEFKFIPDDMHFAREDYCSEFIFKLRDIPQYVVKTRLKGHNYNHPLKRTNTKAQRTDSSYKQYESESYQAMIRFIQNTAKQLGKQVI